MEEERRCDAREKTRGDEMRTRYKMEEGEGIIGKGEMY